MAIEDAIKAAVTACPDVVPFLRGRARWLAAVALARAKPAEVKTQAFFDRSLSGMVQGVYNGNIGGDFINMLADLIFGQINQAYQKAWDDEGDGTAYPGYLQADADNFIEDQWQYVENFYRDIIDARVDQTPIGPLLARVPLWANRYNEAYNRALTLIAAENGGKMVWRLGATEEHCATCSALDGIVAYATEWDTSGLRPQSAPNDLLECGGWRCDCRLEPTDARKTPKALDVLTTIAVSRSL